LRTGAGLIRADRCRGRDYRSTERLARGDQGRSTMPPELVIHMSQRLGTDPPRGALA